MVRATECCPWDAEKEVWRSSEEACSCWGTQESPILPFYVHSLDPSHFRAQMADASSPGLNPHQEGPPTGWSGEGPGQEEHCF